MAGKNRIFKNESYDKIRNTNNLMFLGRKLNLSKILSAALEREMIRDLEKCFRESQLTNFVICTFKPNRCHIYEFFCNALKKNKTLLSN